MRSFFFFFWFVQKLNFKDSDGNDARTVYYAHLNVLYPRQLEMKFVHTYFLSLFKFPKVIYSIPSAYNTSPISVWRMNGYNVRNDWFIEKIKTDERRWEFESKIKAASKLNYTTSVRALSGIHQWRVSHGIKRYSIDCWPFSSPYFILNSIRNRAY